MSKFSNERHAERQREAGIKQDADYFARLRATATAAKIAGYVGQPVPLNPLS